MPPPVTYPNPTLGGRTLQQAIDYVRQRYPNVDATDAAIIAQFAELTDIPADLKAKLNALVEALHGNKAGLGSTGLKNILREMEDWGFEYDPGVETPPPVQPPIDGPGPLPGPQPNDPVPPPGGTNVGGGSEQADFLLRAAELAQQMKIAQKGLGFSLLDYATGVQRDPFSIVPALQYYGGAGGGTMAGNQDLAFTGGHPSPYGSIVDRLLEDLFGFTTTAQETVDPDGMVITPDGGGSGPVGPGDQPPGTPGSTPTKPPVGTISGGYGGGSGSTGGASTGGGLNRSEEHTS